MKMSKLALILIVAVLSGCVTIPQVLEGEFLEISPTDAKTEHLMNKNVRWSGLVIQTINNKDKTCFEIVQTETEKNLRPKNILPKNGSRFLACKEGFLEPHAFNKRMVTITGKLMAYTEQKVGDFQYEYPIVQTDLVYIWRKHNRPYYNHSYPYYPIGHFSCRYSYMSGYCY
jgi:outer membrane lipoprotein